MSSLPSPDPAAPSTRAVQHELLGHLAGTVAHDFNNILAAIAGSAGLIEMDAAGPHTPRHLDNIRRAVQRGAAMLRQLQFFHPRADGPLQPLSPATELSLLVHSLREQFGPTYFIDLTLREPLPSIRADATQFQQIFLCLATNAREAMPQGGTIAIHARPAPDAPDHLEISVHDHGVGISAEVQPRVFEPFFTTKPKSKNVGLGLAIVQRLIDRHGGSVRFESVLGEGSTFVCRFPVSA